METGRRRLLSPDPHQTRICTFPTEAWSSGRMVKRAKAILCLRYPLLLSRVPVLCRATSSHLLNLVNPRFDTEHRIDPLSPFWYTRFEKLAWLLDWFLFFDRIRSLIIIIFFIIKESPLLSGIICIRYDIWIKWSAKALRILRIIFLNILYYINISYEFSG